jgi:hypothetical protein
MLSVVQCSSSTTVLFLLFYRSYAHFLRYDDPRNIFEIGGSSSSSSKKKCNSIFSCPECLNSNGCGWCVSNRGRPPSCQFEYERDTACGEDWIGSTPANQMCPNRLFDGSSASNKHETNKIEGGFGTDKINGKYGLPEQYVLGKFKKQLHIGRPHYVRPEIPEEVLNNMKNDPENVYTTRKGERLPKM